MGRPLLIWQLLPTFFVILLVSLISMAYLAANSFHTHWHENAKVDLESRAALIVPQISPFLEDNEHEGLDALCKSLGRGSSTRITVISHEGKVLADSDHSPDSIENQASRPEIAQALSVGMGGSFRNSDINKEPTLYYALRLGEGQSSILRTAIPAKFFENAQAQFYIRMLWTAAATALLAGVLGWIIVKRILQPIAYMKESAQIIAKGDYAHKLPLPRTREFAELGEAMNTMAQHLDERIRTLTQRINEEEAILLSMVESVIAVDLDERVISVNRAAAELLGTNTDAVKGQNLFGVIRNVGMQDFIAKTMASDTPIEAEIKLHNPNEIVLQAHGTLLRDGEANKIGALIVMNDITRIRRLEQIRRDFVANVSHELRTPITSIKGFVESLLDGALESPEDTDRFLKIIATQSNRLNSIIEDLLTLSRVEQNEESPDSLLQPAGLGSVVHGAIQLCSTNAQQKGITLETDLNENVQVMLNVQLMQQALVNLIDNAIKYSEAGQKVCVRLEKTNGSIAIRVTDQGIGIPSEHLPRLFERFYRVDRARSRSLGGTGLGLAIVKHIVQVHRGTVDVKSVYGEGSTFSIVLPYKNGL